MSLLSIPSFTNVGYLLHSRSFEPVRADLSGHRVVITGGSGGLGRAAAGKLAAMGASLTIVSRGGDSLREAVRTIPGEVEGIAADLSLMSEVRRLADEILSEGSSVDVLINNVGVLLPERQVTEEGLEKTMATDLAGHFLLTNLLVPEMVRSAPSRVINVSSGGMYTQRLRPDDLNFESGEYRGATAYARAKRGQVVLTEMWAEKLRGTGVVVHAMHPGWAKTGGVSGSLPLFDKLMGPFLRTASQGADTMIWLAAADEPARSSGEFWFDRRPVPTHLVESTQETPEERRRLWVNLVELTGADLELGTGG